MRRTLAVAAVTVAACLGFTGVVAAQDPAEPVVPPAFVPPGPAPVTDVATAEAFAESYATRNAWRYLRQSPRRVRVLDANAACLAHPVTADRYGCVFTLRAAVIFRSRGWSGWDKHRPVATPTSRGGKHHKPRFRIRQYGCLGLATVIGGANPQGITRFVECVRVPRSDITAPEPEPVAAPSSWRPK